jgi:Zn-dependent protease
MKKVKAFFSKIPKITWTIATASAVAAVNYSIIHSPFVFFALLVLFAHEISHYFMARKLGSKASLPIFIPLPLFAIAFIRAPGLSNESKLKVALSGPIVGSLTAFILFLLNIIFNFTTSLGLGVLAVSELLLNFVGTDGAKYRSAKRNIALCTS